MQARDAFQIRGSYLSGKVRRDSKYGIRQGFAKPITEKGRNLEPGFDNRGIDKPREQNQYFRMK
ncbi:MAG: hypothetical protein COA42_01195 [Alteromonadaceae bacterium]|nr:MAG: hypothetical protein COA42_01195 [Alteromonadaceae bacterium]